MGYFIINLVISLFIIVLIHELGHLIAAKIYGINVPIYSLGFGKRLFGFKYRETDYRISLIPFGGYCKLEDELEFSKNLLAFTNRSYTTKLLILVSGCFANIITGLVASLFEKYYPFLSLFAYSSIWLGVANLIPFPALDGSYPVLLWLEKPLGKEKALRVIKKIVKYGLLILMIVQVLLLLLLILFWPLVKFYYGF